VLPVESAVLLDESFVLPVVSFVRALVVLPEFAPAVGFVELPVAELEVLPESFESVFFLVLVFFEVVEVSPELACGGFAESVESAAGFFFFFAAVESLCDWSVDCVD
jgi:hypothetical protein